MTTNENDAALHEELRRLPNLRAPEALVPRVRAALARQAAQWWRQPWLDWPRAWQAASATLMFAALGAWWWAEPLTLDHARNSLAQVSAQMNTLEIVFDTVGGFCRPFPDGAGPVELAVVTGMYLVCVGLVVACFRVAASRTGVELR